MTVASKPSYCLLPQVVTPDIVIIVEGDVCPAGFRSPTYNLLEGIQSSLCDLPTFDDWAIINGADCRLLGNGYGCKLAKTQDPVAEEMFCAPCTSCPLPSHIDAEHMKLVNGTVCPHSTALVTYEPLKHNMDKLCAKLDPRTIVNGFNCSLMGSHFGCKVSDKYNPSAETVLCAPCDL